MSDSHSKPADTAAYISSRGDVISFSHKGRVIRFRGPYSLEKIERVVEWDHGYLVVMANYSNTEGTVEDYIDLIPILEDLYIDADAFLRDIETVEVRYA